MMMRIIAFIVVAISIFFLIKTSYISPFWTIVIAIFIYGLLENVFWKGGE